MASVKPNGQLNVGTQTRRLQGSAENKAEKLRGLSRNWRILTSLSLYQRLFFHSNKDLKIQQGVQLVLSVGNFQGISGSPSIFAGGLWKYLEWIESPCLVFVNNFFQLGSRSKFQNCWHS